MKQDGRMDLRVINDKDCKMISEPGDICPHSLEGILTLIGKSWNILILGTLGNHLRLRFNELLDKLGRISPKTLTSRLRELELSNLINRQAYAEIPPRVEYSLTEKGKELFSYLIPIMKWAQSLDHI